MGRSSLSRLEPGNSGQTQAREPVSGVFLGQGWPRQRKHARSQISAWSEASSRKRAIDRSAENSAGQAGFDPRPGASFRGTSKPRDGSGTEGRREAPLGAQRGFHRSSVNHSDEPSLHRRARRECRPIAPCAGSVAADSVKGHGTGAAGGVGRGEGHRGRGNEEREAAGFHQRGVAQRSMRAAKSRRKSSRQRLMWRAPGSLPSAAAGSGSSVHHWG